MLSKGHRKVIFEMDRYTYATIHAEIGQNFEKFSKRYGKIVRTTFTI